MRQLKKLSFLTVLLIWTSIAVLAQDVCPTIVQTALQATEQSCAAVNRNQACYGHVAMSAEARPDATNFAFAESGDIVDVSALQSLQLSPLDTEAGAWGVALFRIQANLPDTLPGQNVTMLVFGDTQIVNAGENLVKLPATIATSGDNLNVRIAPGSSATPIGSLANRQTVTATGRTENGDWLLLEGLDAGSGWAASQFIVVDGDASTLNVVTPDQPHYGPMQAFYLNTGIGEPACNEMPDNGVLVQGPPNGDPVQLTINQVNVEFASTLYIRSVAGEEMDINLLDGAARVEAGGVARPMVEGGYVRIPMGDDMTAAGEPGEFQPYDENEFENLPVDELGHEAEIAEPVSDDDAEMVNEYADVFDDVSLEDYDDLYAFVSDDEVSDEELDAYVESELDPYEDIGGDGIVSDDGEEFDYSGEDGATFEGDTGEDGTGDAFEGDDGFIDDGTDGDFEGDDGFIDDGTGDVGDDDSGDEFTDDGTGDDGSGDEFTDDGTGDDGSDDDEHTDDDSGDDYSDDSGGDGSDDDSDDSSDDDSDDE